MCARKSWTLAPENAAVRARELMQEDFLWSKGDNLSPLGSDLGSVVLRLYKQYRDNDAYTSSTNYLVDILEKMGYSALAEVPWKQDAETLYKRFGDAIVDFDDIVIAVAFSQLVLEGTIAPKLQAGALWSIARQTEPFMLNMKKYRHAIQERRRRLDVMKRVIQEI